MLDLQQARELFDGVLGHDQPFELGVQRVGFLFGGTDGGHQTGQETARWVSLAFTVVGWVPAICLVTGVGRMFKRDER
ncbi:hypothetical protein LFM09_01520 [Lentzea alba]|uniref:hypothetical protein n=1 Tax=Lentzea alba TaxID=2714351 RepID=UPI0039BFE02C